MTWHEVVRVLTRRGMVGKVIGHQASAIARTRSAHLVSCTPAHGRRYSRLATEHQFGGALDADDVRFVPNLRCGPHVREARPSSGAVGAAVRRRHRVRPSPNDGDFRREYRNDTLRKPTLNE